MDCVVTSERSFPGNTDKKQFTNEIAAINISEVSYSKTNVVIVVKTIVRYEQGRLNLL